MVLQYRELCLSCRVAKSVSLHFKFCLYIVYVVLTYFRKFPVCIRLVIRQNSRKTGAVLTKWPYCAAIDANEAEIEARSLQVPVCEPEG